MLFWKKKNNTEEKPVVKNMPPSITFELADNGESIIVLSQWPSPKSVDEAKQLVIGFSNMLHVICTGKILYAIENSLNQIARQGEIEQQLANAILGQLHGMLQEDGVYILDKNRPVVPPSEVFSVRGSQND